MRRPPAPVAQVDAEGPFLVQEREGGPVWWTDRVLAFRLPFDGIAFGALLPALKGARWELGEGTRHELAAALRLAEGEAESVSILNPGLVLTARGRRVAYDGARLIAAQVVAGPRAELVYLPRGAVLVRGRAIPRDGALGLVVAGELVAILAPKRDCF